MGRLLGEVDPAVDAVMVVGPAPAKPAAGLTVASLRAPGVRPGLLRSPTTQRAGYVQLMDVAPSIVGLVGAERPETMRGRPFTVAPSNATTESLRAQLVDGNDAAIFRGTILTPVAVVFTVLVGLLLLAAAAALMLGTERRRWSAPLIAACSIAVLGYVASVYLARLFPFHRIGALGYWAFLFVGAALFAGATWVVARRRAIDALVIGLAALVALLVGDVVRGSNLQFASGFGFSPDVAGRFVGFGNVSYAVLAASSLLLAGMLAARWPGRIGRRAALAVLAVAAVADGAPFWGADVGGVLTLIPAFVLVAVLVHGSRIRVRTIVLSVAATVLAVGLAVAIDMSRPSAERTHLGRLVEQIGGEGSTALTTVVHRKLAMSLATLSSSQWLPMVSIVAVFLVFLVSRRKSLRSSARSRLLDQRAAFLGVALVAMLGFALNDQGIVVPAVMLGILAPALVVLVVAGDPPLPHQQTAVPVWVHSS